jgi:hypothetical protein
MPDTPKTRPMKKNFTRRDIISGTAAALATCLLPPMPAAAGVPKKGMGAGFCERLLHRSLSADLRAGQMRTVVNGHVASEGDARAMMRRAQSW